MNELKIKRKEQRRLAHKRKEKRKYYPIYAYFVILLCMCFGPDIIRYRLAINGEITSGVIYEKKTWLPLKGGRSYMFKYKFYHNGNLYTGKSRPSHEEYKEKCTGDTIKVMFLPKKPEKNDSYNAVKCSGAVFIIKSFK